MESDNLIHLTVGPREQDNVPFGEILYAIRTKAGFSRTEAAVKLGISSEYLRIVERGHRTPSAGLMRHLLLLYDIPSQIDKNTVMFDNYAVKFTSRIQEARRKIPAETYLTDRHELIGQIVILLTTTNETTLRGIHRKLLAART